MADDATRTLLATPTMVQILFIVSALRKS